MSALTAAPAPVDISAIVPVGDRHADMAQLYAEYRAGFERLGKRCELIFVLDGPQLDAAQPLRDLQRNGEDIIVIGLTREFGEATALMAGFGHARGEIVVTLPAYHQIDGSEIPKLVSALEGADLVIGRRWPRAGGRFEGLRRDAFHAFVGWVTGIRFSDLGCGARAMRRRVLEEITLYGDQHRFLAVLAMRQGFRVLEVDVRQSARDRFEGEYRLREYAHRVLDLLTVIFLVRFTKKPLRFFGMIGVLTWGVGALVILYLVTERLLFNEPLADRPALLLASLLAVLGLQLFAIGLLGELIIFTHARHIKDYQVDEVIRFAQDLKQQPLGDGGPIRTAPAHAASRGSGTPLSRGV
jgi:glycosyltransferase involved in cell wall biosynthesis